MTQMTFPSSSSKKPKQTSTSKPLNLIKTSNSSNEFNGVFHELAKKEAKGHRMEQMSIEGLLESQHNDAFFAEISRPLNHLEQLSFYHNENELLVQKIHPEHDIVVRPLLKKLILYFSHHPLLSVHPSGRRLFHRIRCHVYYLALEVNCSAAIRNFSECDRERLKHRTNVREQKLFPATEHSQSVCMDILGEVVRTVRVD